MLAELVAIELQLKGYDGVMSDFRALDQMLNSFRGRKNKIAVQADLATAKKEVIALQGELNKLKEIQSNLGSKGIKSEGLNNKIKETTQRLRDAQQATRELQYALRNLSSMSFGQIFSKISSAVAHMGSAMQSAGNALTRLTNPFANFTKGMVMGAGYRALNKFTRGLQNGFNRYDTMKKYPKIMAAFGYSNEQAEESIKALDLSVRGLPTGLDEMVDLAQRFTATTGDIEKGTKLAIAANNAFLASMSTDTQKYQGMMQLQDVLGGKDMNAREWNSLVSSMTPAIVKMGESMGYTSENMNEFIQTIRDGKMDNQEFIDQLIKIGTEGGVLEAMAQESKNTWQAFFANVGNAASRMTAGIIQALDEISQAATGKDVNQFLAENVINGIDNMTASIKDWVKAHPKEITDFFKSLKAINWGSLAKGVGQGMLEVANLLKSFADIFGDKDLSGIGKWMIRGNILGNFLIIMGGMLKGSRHIIALFGAGGFKGIQSIRNIKKAGGIMGWLKTLAVGDDAKKSEEAVETVTKASGKMGKFSSGLSSLFKGWAEIATMVGGTALVGWGTFKAFKSMFNDLKDIVAITKEIDWSVASADLVAMGGFIATFIGVGTKVGSAIGLSGLKGGAIFAGLTALFAGTFWADMAMIKRGFKAISDAVGYIKEAEDTINELDSISNVPQLKKNIQQAVAVFNALTDILQISRNNPVTGESTKGLKELDSTSASTVKNIASTIKNIKAAVEDLNTLNGVSINTDNLLNIFGRLQHGLNMLSEVLVNMPSVFKDNTASGWASNMSGTVGNIRSALEGIVGENGILAMIPEMINRMEGLDQSGKLLQLPGKMQKLGDALTSIYTSLQGIGAGEYFASNIDSFREGIKSLKFAIKHLQEIGSMEVGGDIVGKIQGIINNIQTAFDASKIAEIQSTIIVFASAIKIALATFESLNGDIEVDVTLKLSQNFYTSKQNVINEINDGRREVKAACKPVSATIRVSVFFSVVSNFASALGRITSERQALQRASGGGDVITVGPGQSTGGLRTRSGVLYRSKGGSIFRPRGTDKIPSMLTEGEYVQRKQAVDFFGLDFMRSVNNMDVRGAMEALLTKAGTSVGVGRQSIFNNTVNNNQKVVQNINTNNPNFAGVQMGRFVGAL